MRSNLLRAWHYFVVEPFTWLFYAFFQPLRFRREIETQYRRFWQRIVPMLRLIIPILIVCILFMLIELIILVLFTRNFPDVLSILLADLQVSAIGVITGIVFSIVDIIAFGIVFGITFGIAFGITFEVIYGVNDAIMFNVALGIVFGIVLGITSRAMGSVSNRLFFSTIIGIIFGFVAIFLALIATIFFIWCFTSIIKKQQRLKYYRYLFHSWSRWDYGWRRQERCRWHCSWNYFGYYSMHPCSVYF